MRQEQKAEVRAWLTAVAVHGVLFVILAASGLFLLVQPVKEQEPVDVDLVEMTGSAGTGGAGAAAATSPTPVTPPLTVAIPSQKLPEIQESYTQEPQKQQAYRQQHQVRSAGQGEAANNTAETGGQGNDGNTSGRGAGNGTAAAGQGAGTTGTGTGAAGNAGTDRQSTERVAAHCTYRPSPVYPESLRQQGVEGSVRVLILVADSDAIESVEVIKSSGYPEMDAAAVNAAYGCRFEMNGRRGRYTTTYGFQLTDGDDW